MNLILHCYPSVLKEFLIKTVPAKLQTYMCLSKPIIGLISGEAEDIIRNANCGITLDTSKIEKIG